MSAPSDQQNHSSPHQPVTAPSADSGDQDIDTAGANASDEGASERGDSSEQKSLVDAYANIAVGDAIDNDDTPIGPHDPSSMPRAEDDAAVRERSPEFHDRPGSGKYR